MKSVMEHQFSRIPKAEIPRSVFNRSNGLKTAFDSGYLVPIYVDEVLPGDTKNLNVSLFGRLSTPIVPFLDNMYLETFFFFVPYRLVWDNWQKFNGEQENPGDSTDYLVPQIICPEVSGWAVGSLADYFGLPTGALDEHADVGHSVSALPFRAYNLIWNEWFRDENLQDSVDVPKDDVTYQDYQDSSKFNLLKRGKRHDYFTSCLPWPQKGPGVELQIGETAPVYGDGNQMMIQSFGGTSGGNIYGIGRTVNASTQLGFKLDTSGANEQLLTSGYYGSGLGRSRLANWQQAMKPSGQSYDPITLEQFSTLTPIPPEETTLQPAFYATKKGIAYANAHPAERDSQVDTVTSGLYADLTQAGAVTINAMREAFQIQKLYERDARGGTRYTEILRAHFGVISPDARLQRPEYLGGGSTKININPVAQSSASDAVTPQGNLAAFGVVADSKHGFTKSFVEHGIIIGLANVRADLNYQQGIDRFWSRKSRFDFYWPALAHLGEMAVLVKELWATGNSNIDEKVFGYQERWAEYRYKNSHITGKLRTQANSGLDVWHLAQYFENEPKLNASFIQDSPPVERVLAVQNEPQILLDAYFDSRDVRPMPVYSVPGLVDHF